LQPSVWRLKQDRPALNDRTGKRLRYYFVLDLGTDANFVDRLMNSPPRDQTVFIVDDEPAVRRSLQWLIETLPVPVQTFPSAASFLEAHPSEEPGCLILDLRMPGMNGLDLQQELIRRGFEIPVIVLTGYGDISSAIRALKSGALEFLEKPVEDDVLLDLVRRALAADAQRRRERSERDVVCERLEHLTPREREVLGLVVEGFSSREIGRQLHVSCKTVEAHRAQIMKKMGAERVVDLVRVVVGFKSLHPGGRASRCPVGRARSS
jgi:two-component system response regulator FixJ